MDKLRKFISSLQLPSGGLKRSSSGKVDLNNAFLIDILLKFNMRDIADRFKKYLINRQNADGGWGPYENASSSVITSACVVKGLLATGISPKDETMQKAAGFLVEHQNFDMGFSDRRGYKESSGWITAVAVEALLRLGFQKSLPRLDEAQLFVRKCFWECKESIDKQLMSINSLKNSDFKVTIEIRELKWRIERLKFSDEGGFPHEKPCLTTTIQIADFLYRNNFKNSPVFNKTLNFIISNRNKDGGWPEHPKEESSLRPTLQAAFLLKELGFLK